MRILVANKFFFPKAGAETVFLGERAWLKSQGHHVIDFAMRSPEDLPSDYASYFAEHVDYANGVDGGGAGGFIEKMRVGARLVHNTAAVRSLTELVRKERPQVAHLHNVYHQLTPSIIPALKREGVKTVMTLHDYKPICPVYVLLRPDGAICEDCRGKNFGRALQHRCRQGSFLQSLLVAFESYWHLWRRSYEALDLILTPSRFMAELMVRYRFDENKVRVLRHGLDLNGLASPAVDGSYALYLGRLSREKGLVTLLEAWKRLPSPFPLKIAGDGPLRDSLAARESGAEFLGHRSGAEISELISNSAFVVVPSEWYENSSMSVLETMAHGKPVLGSAIGGIPEQIEDGRTGLLFEPGNAADLAAHACRMIVDSGLRTSMGRAAREKIAREYSLKSHYDQLLGVYEELLS